MQNSALQTYLSKTKIENINTEFVAYIANLTAVQSVSPETASSIVKELRDQRQYLKLIASENYCSLPVQLTLGNLLTDKYSEGFPNYRFYAGCDNIDDIENFAANTACKLFGAEHAYVQPHSGADANLIACWAILNARVTVPELKKLGITDPSKASREVWEKIRQVSGNQRLLGMDYYSGGHLTHGYRQNVSAQMFDAYNYSVNKETGLIDYDALREQVKEVKPLILLAGYSAYPRSIDFEIMREIADSVNAVLWVDMAHFAGLVAGKVFQGKDNPVEYADIVTTTTHKTLRGPRGGMILCKKWLKDYVNKGCPLVIGGPLPHAMAAKAVAFVEAQKSEFQTYSANIVKNSKTLAKSFVKQGLKLTTGGTDNHLMLIDVSEFNITGRQAETVLRECGITVNRNSLPDDKNGPWYTSGLRVGTPALTSLGMGVKEMEEIASIIKHVLESAKPAIIASGENRGKESKANVIIDKSIKEDSIKRTRTLLNQFPLYPSLDLDFLMEQFFV
ncbi:glycine hydroxymethyltransferase [bacterium]|nr:glycine hydroxymethyltransferase [bacterium]